MELEQKKILVEWMGWQLDPMIKGIYYRKDDMIVLRNWNPDINHNHFAEVWLKLKGTQRSFVAEKFKIDMGDLNESMYLANLILFDLPKVMEAVMEVITTKEN